MKIRVERCPAADIGDVIALDQRCFAEAVDDYTLGSSVWWLALVDGRQAGYAGAKLVDKGSAAYLTRAGVVPRFRGKGLQRGLIEARLAWATKHEVDRAITYTHPQNVHSANNLIRSGFEMYIPTRLWVGKDYLYWRKVLDRAT